MKLRFAPGAPRVFLLAVCAGLLAGAPSPARLAAADDGFPRGDIYVAERYVIWAEQAIAEGRLEQALAALERASDFADASSDVSYLLASVRAQSGQSRLLVLRALEKAFETNRWRRYDEARARLLEAGQLVALRRFYAALNSLEARRALAGETMDSALLRLRALKGLALAGLDFPPTDMPAGPIARAPGAFPPPVMPGANLPAALEFRQRLLETMDRNPSDPRPVRLLFEFVANRSPNEDDRAMVEIALRRLPLLLDGDPALAWMAAPFIGDLEEARRLVLAYRAGSFGPGPAGFVPHPASIAPALNLGLLDDFDAVDEFFGSARGGGSVNPYDFFGNANSPYRAIALDKELIIAVGDLLRGAEGRDRFAEGLHSFTGAISVDENRDGVPESLALFRDGVLETFRHDADQDGVPDWLIAFDTGLPASGWFVAMPDAALSGAAVSDDHEAAWARVHWERYPSVQIVALESRGETFFFAPGNFLHAPIRFENVGASDEFEGLLVPVRDWLSQGLTRRALAMSAIVIERYCLEFEGGRERVYMRGGTPALSEVRADGLLISVTEFENGFPVIQRVDLDRDGRLETVRRFHPGTGRLRVSESDWLGDGTLSVEVYLDDGTVVRN